MSISGTPNDTRMTFSGATFEHDAREVLGTLRKALTDLVTATPGNIRRAADFQRVLKVDSKTSWRIFKITSAADPLLAGIHVPGRPSIERVKNTAAQLKIAKPTIDAVESALCRFESLVEHYAGDRTTFDTMISGFGDEDAGPVDLTHRRAAFRANSHIWGVQSRAQLVTHILHRNSDDPQRFDVASLQVSYDLRRLRRDASWALAGFSSQHDKGGKRVSAQPEPLDPDADDPTGFLAQFSSDPKPQMRVGQLTAGYSNIELVGDTIGIPSESTCVFGHVMRSVAPWYATETDSHIRSRATQRTPAEVTVYDLLVDRATFGDIDIETFLLSDLRRRESVTDPRLNESHILPIRDKAVYMGGDISVLHTTELPRYTEVLSWSLRRLGWQDADYQIFRIRMEYPILPSSVIMEFQLPDRDSRV